MLRASQLDPRRFYRTHAALSAGVESGAVPGAVVGLWLGEDPGRCQLAAAGSRRLPGVGPASLPAQPMLPETIFDLASVTKVMGTASLAARLVERGWIGWEDPLQAFLPAYPRADVLLSHLLSHTAGFAAWSPYWQELRERFAPRPLFSVPIEERQREARRLCLRTLPEVGPGTRALYSDISFLLLGFALEEATGLALDRAVTRYVWGPMGLQNADYRRVDRGLEEGRDSRAAATELCPWRGGLIQGQVHDDNCWAMGGYAGHAGAFGTACDTLTFAARWLNGFFTPGVRARAFARVSIPRGCQRTLGWDTPSDQGSMVGRFFRSGTVGHWGFTGTSLWLDPDARLAVTLLTNRVHPSRDNQAIREFRPRIHDAIRQDLGR